MSEAPEGIPPMVHAVAEALRADCLRTFGATWSYDVSWAFARAAIEAMRDPEGGVIAAVEDKAEERYNAAPQMLRWYGSDVWNAGIDAALADPPASR